MAMRNKDKKFLIKWVMSYLVVIMVSVLISGSMLTYFTMAQKNEMYQKNKTMFDMVQARTDGMFEMLQKIALSLGNNSTVELYLEKSEHSVDETYEIIKTIADENASVLSYNTISGIYLYVADEDYVLNDLGKYPSLDFYKSYSQSDDFSYQKWREIMLGNYNYTYRNMPYKMSGRGMETGICMLHTIGVGEHKATLVMVLNTTMIEELIESTWPDTDVGIAIYDINGTKVFSYGNSETEKQIRLTEAGEKSTGGYKAYNRKSTITMFSYSFICSDNIFRNLYIRIYIIFVLLILIFSLLAAFVVSYYVRKNYTPIERIKFLIENNIGTHIRMDDRVYDYIESALRNTFERQKNMANVLDEQNEQMRKIFVINLLMQRCISHSSIEDNLKKFGISLISDSFYVAIFHIIDIADMFFEKNEGEFDEQMKLANFIIDNIAVEMLSKKFFVMSSVMDDTYTMIINLPDEPDAKNEMINVFREILRFISSEFGFAFKICVSDRVQGLENVHDAYTRAVYTLEYSMALPTGEMVFYSDIQETSSENVTDIMSVQGQYTELMRSRNFVDACRVLEPLFNELETGNMSLEYLKLKMYSLINLMTENIQASAGAGSNISREYADEQVQILSKTVTVADLRSEHKRILSEMHEMENIKNSDKNADLIEKVKNYINENYSDCDMSVSMLAEKFGLNSLYFSRLFTRYTGTYVSDYITKVRLEQVKKLLLSCNDSIAVIAKKTGFYSDVVLIRNFKKNVGTTPGKFRTYGGKQ